MNFDNILNAMLTLFITATIEGWPNYAFVFVDADTIDGEFNSGPIKNNNR
jgi:hypothetical protein